MIWLILLIIYAYFVFALYYSSGNFDWGEYFLILFILPIIVIIGLIGIVLSFLYSVAVIMFLPLKDFFENLKKIG